MRRKSKAKPSGWVNGHTRALGSVPNAAAARVNPRRLPELKGQPEILLELQNRRAEFDK